MSAMMDNTAYGQAAAGARTAFREQMTPALKGSGLTVEALQRAIAERLGDFPLPQDDPVFVQIMLTDIVLQAYVRIVNDMMAQAQKVQQELTERFIGQARDSVSVLVTGSAQYIVTAVESRVQEILQAAAAARQSQESFRRLHVAVRLSTAAALLATGALAGVLATVLLYASHGP